MATPIVSGAAVVLLQKNPSLTPDEVKARLMISASKSFPTSSTAVDAATGIAYTSYYDIFTKRIPHTTPAKQSCSGGFDPGNRKLTY
jgi:subtilisin family serine protease